jgi:monoamine oxidase
MKCDMPRREQETKPGCNRREFLTRSVLTAAAVSVSPLDSFFDSSRRAEQTKPPQKLLVLGAGLAGLSAAYELTQAGHDVRVIEARSRAGGRVLTLREPFANGLYAEAGAARIHASHDQTLKYIRRFNLKLVPFYPGNERYIWLRQNKRQEVKWKKFADEVLESVGVGLDKARDWFRIDGGNDLLPQAFAQKLAEKITYDAPVVKIEQDSRSVRVWFSHRGAMESLTADRLICALPATILKTLEVTPRFSSLKQFALEKLEYTSASRVFLQCRARFWEQQRLNGYAITSQPAEVWASTFGQPGTAGILQCYTRGDTSQRVTRLPESERISTTLAEMERVFPGARENFEHGVSKCWSEDEWTRGAWAHPNQDQLRQLMQPEGRIHFAGEHISNASSWMHGAFESALRAVYEVNQAYRHAT